MFGCRCQRSEHLRNQPRLALAAMMLVVPSSPNRPAESVAQQVAALTVEAQALRGEAWVLAFEAHRYKAVIAVRLEVDVFRCVLERTAVVPVCCSRHRRLGP